MGYTTEFEGQFNLDKKLDSETHTFLKKLSETRRMARNLGHGYGVEGEFYVDGLGFAGQDHDDTIIDYNTPPSTQPSLWCQWEPTDDGMGIIWNGTEKFNAYVQWLEYIIDKILKPRGYTLDGKVKFQGERIGDSGTIIVKDNKVSVR